MAAALARQTAAQEADRVNRPDPVTQFEVLCPEKNPPERDRLRVCEKMILTSAGNYRESVLFLRARVNDLIDGTAKNAERARARFHWWSVITVILAVIAALVGIFTEAFASRLQRVLFVLVGFCPLIIGSFGWKEQLQAEQLAWEHLSNLRDNIDIAVASAAGSGDEVTGEHLRTWTTRLNEVVRTHADEYSKSFSIFSPAQILGSPAEPPG
ncbi:SLATT domain-containing protein [Sinorhizobium meliloti]|uniref:SLATT domain-containing protein n=1 Tax=Rhizobium meliloti TaxID=382 RepID=UPI0013E3A6FA|nr:SLATT domain-containing protein [Sinorhizobium meliloti]